MLQIHYLFIVALSLSSARCGVVVNTDSIAASDNYNPGANGWLKFHRHPTTWENARLICDLEGARLASPIDELLYSEMRMLMLTTGCKSIYTGIHSLATVNDYFSEEGIHLSKMKVTWAVNEPNNLNDNEKCIAMLPMGALADVKCNSLNAFICYKKNTTKTTDKCGSHDYVQNNRTGNCYKVHLTPATWDGAHTTCTAEGGHLAIINSKEEAMVLSRLLFKGDSSPKQFFVGFYNWARYNGDTYTRWATMDGKTLKEAGYSRWQQGEPNNQGGNEFCGTFLHHSLELNDVNCNISLPYICEIDVFIAILTLNYSHKEHYITARMGSQMTPNNISSF